MNDRIRELAEQANVLHADFFDNELEVEKFATLIIQECIDIISPYTIRMSRPGEEYLHPIIEIKENFGVKK